ncbi:hypothetical protein HRI_003431200 [Hibiscus trionum]|uniref:Uncharacterized protein n=1 Tax=Hibiscus trionum TaxID=183268 RepID=A0A9W7IJ41_HIBTR|nr:hypothetical protein HRI_003431200 [Hibiscus trionum]
MAAGATAETMLRSVLAGSLVMQEFEVERRPYHKNCGCALHNLKGICSSACSRARNLSFPKKNNWRNIDCSLSMANPQFSSRSYPVVGTSIKSVESKATTGVSFMACEK